MTSCAPGPRPPCRRACYWSLPLLAALAAVGLATADSPTRPLRLPPPLPPRKPLPPLPRPSTTRTRPSAERLAYQFTKGQTFAYQVEFLTEHGHKTERYAGTPVYTVAAVDPKTGEAHLSAVGKLSYSVRLRGQESYKVQPGNDVWLASYVKVGPQGQLGGKKDRNVVRLHGYLHLFAKPTELIFVSLPRAVGAASRRTSTGMLWEQASADPSSPGALINPMRHHTVKGISTEQSRAELEAGSVCRVVKKKGFRSTEGPAREWTYQGTSRFDRQRGLVLSTEARFDSEEKGQPAAPVVMHMRLLEGDALARAKQQAKADVVSLPAELRPQELKRVRLDLKKPQRLKTTEGLEPGTAVAHFFTADKGGDYHWYRAEVVQVLSEDEVKIRYRGSQEEMTTHVGHLTLLSANKRAH